MKHHSAHAKNFKSQVFNHYLFLTYIYITFTILTKITIFNCYGVKTTFVP